MQLLQDLIVLDFSQFLSGPSAGLRLADMGAQVIKIEKPVTGDICRQLYVSDVIIEGESTIFHAINRNKQSYAADFKNSAHLDKLKQMIAKADVLIHNFRPGVMERAGLGYDAVKKINPAIVYASISGYGEEGNWKQLPGQDLLLQSVSGLTWLNNDADKDPTPVGVSVVDILAGTHLAQGILAALYRRIVSGEGALIKVSMMETVLDFQFEVLTAFYNDGHQLPLRGKVNNAHAYIAAPYGIYKTANGFMALAMCDIMVLGRLIQCPALAPFSDASQWFEKRDEIKAVIAGWLLQYSTEHWLNILQPADIWCANVLNYESLVREEGYKSIRMEMKVKTSNGLTVKTTRCPIRVDGELLVSARGAPLLGEHNSLLEAQFGII